jgi:hypothetical protein
LSSQPTHVRVKKVLATYIDRVGSFHPNARLYLTSVILTGAALGVFRLLFNFYILSLGYNEALLGTLITTSSLTAPLPDGEQRGTGAHLPVQLRLRFADGDCIRWQLDRRYLPTWISLLRDCLTDQQPGLWRRAPGGCSGCCLWAGPPRLPAHAPAGKVRAHDFCPHHLRGQTACPAGQADPSHAADLHRSRADHALHERLFQGRSPPAGSGDRLPVRLGIACHGNRPADRPAAGRPDGQDPAGRDHPGPVHTLLDLTRFFTDLLGGDSGILRSPGSDEYERPVYQTYVMENVEPSARATVASLVSMTGAFSGTRSGVRNPHPAYTAAQLSARPRIRKSELFFKWTLIIPVIASQRKHLVLHAAEGFVWVNFKITHPVSSTGSPTWCDYIN